MSVDGSGLCTQSSCADCRQLNTTTGLSTIAAASEATSQRLSTVAESPAPGARPGASSLDSTRRAASRLTPWAPASSTASRSKSEVTSNPALYSAHQRQPSLADATTSRYVVSTAKNSVSAY